MGTINLKHSVVCAVLILTMGCKEQTGNDLQLVRSPNFLPAGTRKGISYQVSAIIIKARVPLQLPIHISNLSENKALIELID